ncbi:MAG: ribonuclease HII [Chitinophagaceae bacterium]|nr:MAG: ribonuclease HII [Chitinophagaceae bacterium]
MLQSYYHETMTEAGCDEAGRGCFAGPVFAAAVILPKNFYHPLLNDSKQVPKDARYELRTIIEKEAVAFAVASIQSREIDKLNILWASVKAMHKAIDQLPVRPDMLLIDGNRFKKYKKVAHQCVVKGDGIYASIAAASILAKTYRDDHMIELHRKFPHYRWDSNKGYGTLEHREALKLHGVCKHHRMSFRLFQAPDPELFEEDPLYQPDNLPD